jgi:hypothetical protein
MRVVLEPLDAGDREQITRPLLEGSTAANCPLQACSG